MYFTKRHSTTSPHPPAFSQSHVTASPQADDNVAHGLQLPVMNWFTYWCRAVPRAPGAHHPAQYLQPSGADVSCRIDRLLPHLLAVHHQPCVGFGDYHVHLLAMNTEQYYRNLQAMRLRCCMCERTWTCLAFRRGLHPLCTLCSWPVRVPVKPLCIRNSKQQQTTLPFAIASPFDVIGNPDSFPFPQFLIPMKIRRWNEDQRFTNSLLLQVQGPVHILKLCPKFKTFQPWKTTSQYVTCENSQSSR